MPNTFRSEGKWHQQADTKDTQTVTKVNDAGIDTHWPQITAWFRNVGQAHDNYVVLRQGICHRLPNLGSNSSDDIPTKFIQNELF